MYKIVGADQKEYGPVTAEQLKEWIAQGRANANTLISFEGGPWRAISTYPELAPLLGAAPPPAPQTYVTMPGARSNGMAVTGLVLSVLGLMPCCPFLGIISIIFSAIGLSQIQKNPQAYTTTKIVPILGLILGMFGVLETLGILLFGDTFERIWREIQQQH
jgi:hypothetical protein